jgi:short-subunit dehydrogenase
MSRSAPRSALITGASSGIGRALARALPPTADLLLTGRDAEALETLGGELGRAGRRVETLAADLTGDPGRARLIAAGEAFAPELLVNNAGLGAFGRVLDHAPETERALVELNVVAPTVLTRALLPGMLERARAERRRAGVILLASTAAFQPLPYLATYAATKAFDHFYALGLAREMAGEPLDVLSVCPGPTETAFFVRAGRNQGAFGPAVSTPEEVARQALAALGRQESVTVGAGNRAYRVLSRLAPEGLLRGPTRRALRRGVREG